jgi:cell division protein FtsI (penicillin-binding protein 3)
MSVWRRSKRTQAKQQPILPGLFTPTTSRRLATPHDQALDVAHGRLVVASLVFLIAFTVIAGKVGYLTLLNEGNETPITQRPINDSTVSRADITDRNGIVLATSLPTSSLFADTKALLNADEAATQLAVALPDLDITKLKTELHSPKRYVAIKRHLTPKQAYEVNKLGIAGLEFHPDEHRMYPTGTIAAHVVGYTDIDNNGIAGIEKSFDTHLQEQPDAVTLSLDLRLQGIMHEQLQQAMDTFHALGATGLIMDVTTGEILSLVSLPDFDPQHAGDATDDERFNRATLGVYEMGSTFKIFNTALALDSGLIHVQDSFDTVHPIEIGHQTIKDFHPEGRWLNVAEIFTHSSNIGAAHMAERIGGVRQRAFLGNLGLMQKASLELPEVGAPLVPSARDWGDATTMTVAFGHGIAVNSIQLCSAVATIVNDGRIVHPTLLKKSDFQPVSFRDETPVISERTSATMRAMMRLVVTHGTAKGAEVPGYLLGGKTGTADKLSANHHYNPNARLSSFIGVFPLSSPRYIVFAMLDDPKGNAKTYGFATGGWTAAPVVSHVVSEMAPLVGLAPLPPEKEAAAERKVLKPLGSQILDGLPVEEGSDYASVEADTVE